MPCPALGVTVIAPSLTPAVYTRQAHLVVCVGVCVFVCVCVCVCERVIVGPCPLVGGEEWCWFFLFALFSCRSS